MCASVVRALLTVTLFCAICGEFADDCKAAMRDSFVSVVYDFGAQVSYVLEVVLFVLSYPTHWFLQFYEAKRA